MYSIKYLPVSLLFLSFQYFFSVRASCAFMLHVCQDEHQLFRHFFNNTSQVLDDMLERLCQGLLVSKDIQIIVHLRAL